MELGLGTSLAKAMIVGVEPTHETLGVAGAMLVKPGAPEQSILLRRMTRRGPYQMPTTSTNRVDAAGGEAAGGLDAATDTSGQIAVTQVSISCILCSERALEWTGPWSDCTGPGKRRDGRLNSRIGYPCIFQRPVMTNVHGCRFPSTVIRLRCYFNHRHIPIIRGANPLFRMQHCLSKSTNKGGLFT